MNCMDKLLAPKSIALVGVSKDPGKLSHMLMRNVVNAGTAARIYPISRSGGEVLGFQTYPSLASLPESPDLVLVSIGSEQVIRVVSEAARAKVGVVVVLSSGFGETGNETGKVLERELREIARAGGIRIMGPNCLGVYNAQERLNATYFVRRPKRPGNISVASQSGAYGGILVNELEARGLGLAKFASIGNQLDVLHQDVVAYLAEDAATEVIGLFVEGIKEASSFLETIRRASRLKPVVIFKAGRTPSGRRAAASHTGAIAGDFDIAAAAFRQAGALVAANTDEFLDYLSVFSCNSRRLPKDESIAIITISGGPSVIAGDRCEEVGLRLADLSAETRRQLRKFIPPFASDANPVDMTVATRPEDFAAAVEAIMAEPAVSGAIAINWGFDEPAFANAVVSAAAKLGKPVVAYAVENPRVQRVFRQHGIFMASSPERAAESYWALIHYSRVCARDERTRVVGATQAC